MPGSDEGTYWVIAQDGEKKRRTFRFFDGPRSYRKLLSEEGYNLPEEHIFAFGADPKLKVPLDGQENQVFIGLVILGITVERMAENLACTQQEILILIERALLKLDLI